jgi:hypothetical protein
MLFFVSKRWLQLVGLLCLWSSLNACAASDDVGTSEFNVKVDTQSEQAWAQYLRNLQFAQNYRPKCLDEGGVGDDSASDVKRVLVTGFGRFQSNQSNASGLAVAEMAPGLDYPLTLAPAAGEVDDPASQTAATRNRIKLADGQEIDVCAMVLPVFWDLSAVLVLRELAAFKPDLVILNGIAGPRQPLWLELGARNRANGHIDGSNLLGSLPDAPLLADAPESEYTRYNWLSWHRVREALELRRSTFAADDSDFAKVVTGVETAQVRDSNSYLCNNTTYLVGYAMDHPGQSLRLMEASHPREGFDASLSLSLEDDYRGVPRVFIHWPSQLAGGFVPHATELLRTAIEAQLSAPEPAISGEALQDDKP